MLGSWPIELLQEICLYDLSGDVLAVVEAKRGSRNAREVEEPLRHEADGGTSHARKGIADNASEDERGTQFLSLAG